MIARRLVAFPLAVGFTLVFPVALFAFVLSGIVLRPAFIEPALASSGVYELLQNEVVPSLGIEPVARVLPESALRAIGDERLREILRQAAPAAWLQENAERLIDAAYPYLRGSTDSFRVTIALDDRRDAIVEALGGVLRLPTGVLDNLDATLAAQFPSELVLTQAQLPVATAGVLGKMERVLQVTAGALCIFLLVIGLLGGRGWRGALRWVAATLGVGAVAAWGLTLAVGASVPGALPGMLIDLPTPMAERAGLVLGPLVVSVLQPIADIGRAIAVAAGLAFALTLLPGGQAGSRSI